VFDWRSSYFSLNKIECMYICTFIYIYETVVRMVILITRVAYILKLISETLTLITEPTYTRFPSSLNRIDLIDVSQ
jgi:hypothetical protein